MAMVAQAAAEGSSAPKSKVARPTPLTIQLPNDAHHRAIFCGHEGTETSAIYSQVLVRDLKVLEATGRTTAESLAYIKAQACNGA